MLYDGTLSSCVPEHTFQLQQVSLLGATKHVKAREARDNPAQALASTSTPSAGKAKGFGSAPAPAAAPKQQGEAH